MIDPAIKPPYRASADAYFAVVSARTDAGIYRAVASSNWSVAISRASRHLVDSVVHHLGEHNLEEVVWTGFIYEAPPRYVCETLGVVVPGHLYRRAGVYFFPYAVRPAEKTYSGSLADRGLISTEGQRLGPLLEVKELRL